MSGAYFKLLRKFKKNYLWTEPRAFSRFEAWLDLITEARYEDGVEMHNGRLYRVKRGQVISSVRTLSRRWRWSWKKTSTFLEHLAGNEMIARTGMELRRDMISVLNYDKLQRSSEMEWTQSGRTLFKKGKKVNSPVGEKAKKGGAVQINLIEIDCPICEERHPVGRCSISQELVTSSHGGRDGE